MTKAQQIIQQKSPRTRTALLHPALLTEAGTHATRIGCEQAPRDVLLSQSNKWRRRSMGAAIPRSGDLRAQPQDRAPKICAHIEIGYDPDTLDVPQAGSSARKDKSAKNVIVRNCGPAWRNAGLASAEITIFETATADQMRSPGYEGSGSRAGVVSVALQNLLMPLRLLGALALNLWRPGNIPAAPRGHLTT